jgi:hypothetical protein
MPGGVGGVASRDVPLSRSISNNADCQLQASLSLVFVRLAHDRRLVGMVFFFLLVLFVFIRISGGIVLSMITKGLQLMGLVKDSSEMCCFMLLLLGCELAWNFSQPI